jgi:hypothetical protein
MTGRSLAISFLAFFCLSATPARPQEAAPAPEVVATPPPPQVGRGVYLVREFRNPTLAAALSLAVPGGGQVYNDDLAKFLGAVAGIAAGSALVAFGQDPALRIVGGAGAGFVWAWSIGDAYLAAALYNRLLEEQAF